MIFYLKRKIFTKIELCSFCLFLLFCPLISKAVFTCQLKSSCSSSETALLGVSALDNAHAELSSYSNYPYRLCCTNSGSSLTFDTSCGTPFLSLSSSTNAHVEKYSLSNYTNDICINSSPPTDLNCHYESGSCSSGSCILSLSGDTNAHLGDCGAYSEKVCCDITVSSENRDSPGTCEDGIDNDADGKKDADDADCEEAIDSEDKDSPGTCADGIDNDKDGYVDAADAGCDAFVDKDNIFVTVSTVDQDNWYDDRCSDLVDNDFDGLKDQNDPDCDGGNIKDADLDTFVVCDGISYRDYEHSPCNTGGPFDHYDYYSTSTNSEINVQPQEKDFTIRIDAADSFGIQSVKIEWINGDKVLYNDWLDANPQKSSFTCMGSDLDAGYCEICINGGTCKNDVISDTALDISGGKTQQRLFFRAIISDNNNNSIVLGYDNDLSKTPILDKFYRFVVCSSDCYECIPANSSPVATLDYYDVPADFCNGLNYTLRWIFTDSNSGDKQASYAIEVREKGTTEPTLSVTRPSSNQFFTIFNNSLDGGDIQYGKNYEWRVKVSDDDDRSLCVGVSEWSDWSDADKSFTTPPHAYPDVAFSASNIKGEDCLDGDCSFLDEINFVDDSTTYATSGSNSYAWYVDDFSEVYSTEKDMTKVFLKSETTECDVKLKVTDGSGYSCSYIDSVAFTNSFPVWNEISPQ